MPPCRLTTLTCAAIFSKAIFSDTPACSSWAAAVALAAGLALFLVNPKVKPPAPPALALDKAPFVALDNEPIDAGLVVRVSLGPNNVQADVIITADGRARAYRLVNNQSTN